MTRANPLHILTATAYLDWEAGNSIRHEYIDGDVFAMAGATDAHVTIAGNLFAALRTHLRGGPCRVYISDMKVRVESANAFFYPDVLVSCDEQDRANMAFKQHPILIIEVLSDSTAAFDRGQKFALYRQLASLREYVVIDPTAPALDCFRRDENNRWVLYPFSGDSELEFSSVGFRAPLRTVYEDVIFSSAPSPNS